MLKRRNNIVGSDNLAIAILPLGHVAKMRQPMRILLIYLAHSIGLIAISKAIDVVFPNLSKLIWGIILVVLMAIEWCVYLYHPTFKLNSNSFKFDFIASNSKHSIIINSTNYRSWLLFYFVSKKAVITRYSF